MMMSAIIDWNNCKKGFDKIFPIKFQEKSRNFRPFQFQKLHYNVWGGRPTSPPPYPLPPYPHPLWPQAGLKPEELILGKGSDEVIL